MWGAESRTDEIVALTGLMENRTDGFDGSTDRPRAATVVIVIATGLSAGGTAEAAGNTGLVACGTGAPRAPSMR